MNPAEVVQKIQDRFGLKLYKEDLLSFETTGTGLPSIPFTCTITLRPYFAEQLKGRTQNNRNIKPISVAKYTKSVSQATWYLTHQGLAVDAKGVFVDGQHRVEAVLRSKTAIVTKITFGLEKDAVRNMDIGAKRTDADAVRMDGIEYAAKIVPELRVIYYAFGYTSPRSVDDTVLIIRDAESFIHRFIAATDKRECRNAAIGAAVFLAQFGENEKHNYADLADAFFTGANLQGDSPLLGARAIAFERQARNYTLLEKVDQMGRLLTAFKYYYQDKSVKDKTRHIRASQGTLRWFVERMPAESLLRSLWEETADQRDNSTTDGDDASDA